MLILTRKINEEIKIDGDITVKIISISENSVRIGIIAPKEIQIIRSEIYEKVKENSETAVKMSTEKPVDLSKVKIKRK